MKARGIPAVFVMTALLAGRAAGDERPRPGARVRLHARSGETIQGVLLAWSEGSILVRSEDPLQPRAVDPASLDRVEVSTGRVSRAGRGALIGALFGASMPLVLGSIASARGADVGGREIRNLTRLTLPAGALAGALIGAMAKKDLWKIVDAPSSGRVDLQIHIAPESGIGGRVTLSW